MSEYETFCKALPTTWRKNSWHRYDMKKLRHCHPMYIMGLFVAGCLKSTSTNVESSELNWPSEQDGDIVVVRMCFVRWIHAHLPLTEARQRLVSMMADLQVWLLYDMKHNHYQQHHVSDKVSRVYERWSATTSCTLELKREYRLRQPQFYCNFMLNEIKIMRCGFCPPNLLYSSEQLAECDDRLFNRIRRNPQHVLYSLLPPPSAASQNYSIAYSVSNICAKNYQNRLMCVEVIVCNISVVFLRHNYMYYMFFLFYSFICLVLFCYVMRHVRFVVRFKKWLIDVYTYVHRVCPEKKGATMFLPLTLLNTDDSQILLPTDMAIHFWQSASKISKKTS